MRILCVALQRSYYVKTRIDYSTFLVRNCFVILISTFVIPRRALFSPRPICYDAPMSVQLPIYMDHQQYDANRSTRFFPALDS